MGLGGTAVSGNDVTLRSLEAPIYSANRIKVTGTPVLAVVVGAGVSGAGPNLRAISGPVKGQDYFQAASWDDLNEQLSDIAKGLTCQVPGHVPGLPAVMRGAQ